MFGLIRRWRERRRKSAADNARRIFRYWDGSKEIAVDPVGLFRKLNAHKTFNLEKHTALAEAGDMEAAEIALKAIREIFELPEWSEVDGRSVGVTDFEAFDVLANLGDFMRELKKNGRLNRTLQSYTESESLPNKFDRTSASSAYGSIPNAR